MFWRVSPSMYQRSYYCRLLIRDATNTVRRMRNSTRLTFGITAFVGIASFVFSCEAATAVAPDSSPPRASVIVAARLDPAVPHTLIYPPIANWNAQQGTVQLQLLVGTDGWVSDARISMSSGYVQLDAAALLTVGYWHYLPATRDGIPTASTHSTQMRFALEDTSPYDHWQIRAEPSADSVDQSIAPRESSLFLLYPKMARRNALQGDVTLRILVRSEGYISDAQVIHSSGYSQLDSAALVSVGYWNYLPAIKDGIKIDSWKTVSVHLAPKDSGPESPAEEYAPTFPNAPFEIDNGVSTAGATKSNTP
jgi:TonB family protein